MYNIIKNEDIKFEIVINVVLKVFDVSNSVMVEFSATGSFL